MYLAKWNCEGDSTKMIATAASWIRNQSASLNTLTKKTSIALANYCASPESILKAE